jgi:dTDP-4-amino-4,6-dideoxygalactose transaminase
MVYYARPMHVQGAFEESDSAIADCPVTEKLCKIVLSLPMHPYMTEDSVSEVVEALINAIK